MVFSYSIQQSKENPSFRGHPRQWALFVSVFVLCGKQATKNMKTAALEPHAKLSLKKVNPNREKAREALCFKFLTFWVRMQIPKGSRWKPRKLGPGPLLWAAGRPCLCSCGTQLLRLPTSLVSSDAPKEVSATATDDFRRTTLTEAQP